jgi:hypothetical protein
LVLTFKTVFSKKRRYSLTNISSNLYIFLPQAMSKKTEKKKQEKVIQDRTFGLKNKNKSKTVQK